MPFRNRYENVGSLGRGGAGPVQEDRRGVKASDPAVAAARRLARLHYGGNP